MTKIQVLYYTKKCQSTRLETRSCSCISRRSVSNALLDELSVGSCPTPLTTIELEPIRIHGDSVITAVDPNEPSKSSSSPTQWVSSIVTSSLVRRRLYSRPTLTEQRGRNAAKNLAAWFLLDVITFFWLWKHFNIVNFSKISVMTSNT